MTEAELRSLYRDGRRLYKLPRVRSSLPATFAILETEYRQDLNPRHVWQAYGMARAGDVAIPEWVMAYLDRVAETMHVLNINPPSERQIANAAARALELPRGGRRNAFKEWPKQNHEELIALEVESLLDQGHKMYEAARRVGRKHPTAICRALFPQCLKPLSRATVEGYYKRFARKA